MVNKDTNVGVEPRSKSKTAAKKNYRRSNYIHGVLLTVSLQAFQWNNFTSS